MSVERAAVQVEILERALLDGVHELDGEPERVRIDLGLVLVFSDERPLHGLGGLIDWRGSGRLSKLLRSGFCTGARGEQLLLPCDARLPIDRLVLIGLGPRPSFDAADARSVARRLVEISAGLCAQTVLIALPTWGIDRAVAEALVEALVSALHESPLGSTGLEGSKDGGHEGPAASEEEAEAGERDESAEAVEAQSGPTAEDDEIMSEPRQDVLGVDPTRDPPAAADATALPSQPLRSPPETRWWVAADEAIVARLRRVLSGPPRAARGGASLHT